MILTRLLTFVLISFLGSVEALQAPSGVIVIFGASGDLTSRKLMPALYHLVNEGELSENTVVVGVGRTVGNDEDFRQRMHDAVERYVGSVDGYLWQRLSQKLFYHCADFDDEDSYDTLRALLQKLDASGNHAFYLATQPSYFPTIIERLSRQGLTKGPNTKVVIEKPFGYDLESALQLQELVDACLRPEQVYRMDHYLGKQGVQSIPAMRFESGFFEHLWSREHIDSVQITLAEEIGIGTRGDLWENTGLLRDVVQNHLLQVLALVAMEPPVSEDTVAFHKAKIALLHVVRPLDVDNEVVRGQYASYKQESNVASDSQVETYVAARLWIDNDRWWGVPFHIRAGKRLARQLSEVVVTFKPIDNGTTVLCRELFIRIQPDAGITMRLAIKASGADSEISSATIGFKKEEVRSPEAYEKLLQAVLCEDSSLFVEGEEQLAAWRLITPVLERWREADAPSVQIYEEGTWGP